jgi:hypothetical protein
MKSMAPHRPGMGEIAMFPLFALLNFTEWKRISISVFFNIVQLQQVFLLFKVKIAEIVRL